MSREKLNGYQVLGLIAFIIFLVVSCAILVSDEHPELDNPRCPHCNTMLKWGGGRWYCDRND